ncbi:hypothetical protein OG866_02245 [Streptomyces sp. NBC_00663]|nr:hypothetical protein [Streptomyces sp. NBC_00663]
MRPVDDGTYTGAGDDHAQGLVDDGVHVTIRTLQPAGVSRTRGRAH